MPEETSNGKILAMYDVRGIQNFIFRTNKAKEIMGASRIVEEIIEKALAYGLEETKREGGLKEKDTYCLNWNNDEELEILTENSPAAAQVLFIGGGNAYVMYRNKELAVKVNKKMALYVLKETYSLQLAAAMVNVTDSYKADYQNVQNEMIRIKASMPYAGCLGAPSVVAVDDMTGFPCSVDLRVGSEAVEESKFRIEELKKKPEYKDRDSLSYESIQKLAAYYYEVDKEGEEKIHNNLITEYGKESTLAVVHIDGNNMGMRIRDLMENETDYEKAVKKMRTISQNINNSFKETFENTEKYIKKWVQSDDNEMLKKEKDGREAVYVRKILVAGDDITFVCNAKLALPMVEYFIHDVTGKVMYDAADLGKIAKEESLKKYGFSVCAGIAYVHSHFPFKTAYDVAEECCSSAKERAKKEENRQEDRIANWVDFQICKSVHNIDLKKSRKKNYELSEGEWLLRRPYYIKVDGDFYEDLNKQNEKYSFEHFKRIMEYFKDNPQMPRSLAKEFRNTYPLGRNAVEELIGFALSREKLVWSEEAVKPEFEKELVGLGFIELEKKDTRDTAAWYDALEMMDHYISLDLTAFEEKLEKESGKSAEKKEA